MADPISSTIAATPPAGAPSAPSPNVEHIKALASQFEAMLMSQMLKDMQHSIFDGGDEGDADADQSMSPLADTMFSELGLALSRAGGLGLSNVLTSAITRQTSDGSSPASPSAPGGLTSTNLAALTSANLGALTPASLGALPAADAGDTSTPPMLIVPDAAAIAPYVAAITAGAVRPTSGDAVVNPPVDGSISSGFGLRRDPIDGTLRFHNGIDVRMPVGSSVRAASAGRIVAAGNQSGYGLAITVDHGGGLETKYAHLSAADVNVGDTVAAGQVIGLSGSSGRSTGPHLHFEVLEGGQAVDPRSGAAAALMATALGRQ